jgi:predicted MFS family arabinose efflux permease
VRRHTFDPLSAALGILAVAIGVLVAAAEFDELGSDAGGWVIAGVLLVGLALVPWSRLRPRRAPDDGPTPPV